MPTLPKPKGLASALLALGVAMTSFDGFASPDAVDLETARKHLEAGSVVMIDIREPREHVATGVAANAKLIPMSQLRDRLGEIPTDPAKPVYLICNTQNRSNAVLNALRQLGGYSHVRYVEGGMSGWVRQGMPVVSPGR